MTGVASAMDQALSVSYDEIEIAAQRAHEIAHKALDDPDIAFRYAVSLRKVVHLQGVELAALFFEMRQKFEKYGFESEDDFYDTAYERTGYAVETLRKYANMWESVLGPGSKIPKKTRAQLASLPVRTQLLLTGMAREDKITNEQWEKVSKSPDHQTVREFIRKVRGQRTSARNALNIKLSRDGTVNAYQGNIGPIDLFILVPNDRGTKEEKDIRKRGQERVLNASGVLR